MVRTNSTVETVSDLVTTAKQKRIALLFGIYTFLSGFVFIEPSPAEIFFVLLLPFLLVTVKWSLSFLIESLFLLFLPLVTSTVAGLFQDGFINPRFIVIDVYLFVFYMVMSSAISTEGIDASDLLENVMKFWTYAALVNIAAGLFCYVSGKTMLLNVPIIRFGIRLTGFFKDPNVLGPFIVVPLLYNLDLLIKGRDIFKRLFLIIALALGALLSFSRAAWLNTLVAVVILLGYYGLFGGAKNKKYVFLMIVFMLAAVYVLLLTSPQIMGFRLIDFLQSRLGLQSYDEQRFRTQLFVVEILQSKNILFGIGPGRYEEYAGMSTHSLYLRYLGERGLFGFLTLIVWFVIRFKSMRKTSLKIFFFSSLLGQLANSVFIDSLHWRHLWVLFILTNAEFSSGSIEKSIKIRGG